MLEKMLLAGKRQQDFCWETRFFRNRLYDRYLRECNALLRSFREAGMDGEADAILSHRFKTSSLPVRWDNDWMPDFLNNSNRTYQPFIHAAEKLRILRDTMSGSTLRTLVSDCLRTLVNEGKTVRIIIPSRSREKVWDDFIAEELAGAGLPGNICKTVTASKIYLLDGDIDTLFLVGPVFRSLGEEIHQVITAPRWHRFIHLTMENPDSFHRSHPDYLTPIVWSKSRDANSLRQRLNNREGQENPTILLCSYQHIIRETELPLPDQALQEPYVGPDTSRGEDGWSSYSVGEASESRSQRYSGLARLVTVEANSARYAIHQPLFHNATYGPLDVWKETTFVSTEDPSAGDLVLCELKGRRAVVQTSEPAVWEWQTLLLNRLETLGLGRVESELSAKGIRLDSLRNAIPRWTKGAAAPKKRKNFRILNNYLKGIRTETPKTIADFREDWKQIRNHRGMAVHRGFEEKRRRLAQLSEKVLADFPSAASGSVLLAEDSSIYFLSRVLSLDDSLVKRALSECLVATKKKRSLSHAKDDSRILYYGSAAR